MALAGWPHAVAVATIALVVVLAPAGPAAASAPCTDRPDCWPEGGAMHTGLLLRQRQEVVDRRLDQAHQRLLAVVAGSGSPEGGASADGRLLQALKTQQAAWRQYRREECELVGALTGAGGSWPSTYAVRCETNQAEQRLRRVRSALRCIERLPADRRPLEQNDCLQQLAPLTNRL